MKKEIFGLLVALVLVLVTVTIIATLIVKFPFGGICPGKSMLECAISSILDKIGL